MPDVHVDITTASVTVSVDQAAVAASVVATTVEATVASTTVETSVAATTVDVAISGGGLPHRIQEDSVALPQRHNLNFMGAGVSVADDEANNATVVTITGGGGGAATITVTAGENIAELDLIYIAADGTAYKADATSDKEAMFVCPAAITAGDTGDAYPTGAALSGFASLSPGLRYFLSATTPGTFSLSIPTGAGDIVQQVGHALSASSFYFCPTVSILVSGAAATFNRLTETGDTRITEAGYVRVTE